MARRRYEFRPDRFDSGWLDRLYLTPKQRQAILKWTLYAVVLTVLSVLQDVVFSRIRYLGGTTDLLPCAIVLICLEEGSERGSLFALIASACYAFSGSAPGLYCIALITFLGVFSAMFRQGFLRKGFAASMLCVSIAVWLYELIVFGVVLFFGQMPFSRWPAMAVTGIATLAVAPVLYPIVRAVGKIGGETWKD